MNDVLGGFSGLIKGLSNFMPQDDPNVNLLKVQAEVSDWKKQETEILTEIGRQALERGDQFPELESRLKLVQENMATSQARLRRVQEEKEAQEEARRAEEKACTCLSCGSINPQGVRFCQECGFKLEPNSCYKCGAALLSGARFCGECGAKQE